jgi:hypothetical protein
VSAFAIHVQCSDIARRRPEIRYPRRLLFRWRWDTKLRRKTTATDLQIRCHTRMIKSEWETKRYWYQSLQSVNPRIRVVLRPTFLNIQRTSDYFHVSSCASGITKQWQGNSSYVVNWSMNSRYSPLDSPWYIRVNSRCIKRRKHQDFEFFEIR